MALRSPLAYGLPLVAGLVLALTGCALLAGADASDIAQGGAGAGAEGGEGGAGVCIVEDCPAGPCESAACEGGECAREPMAQGVPCSDSGGQLCDGSGRCVQCLTAAECEGSDSCVGSVCVLELCANGAIDGDETDIDCGGATCPPCTLAAACQASDDCESGFCDSGACAACSGDTDCQSDSYCDPNGECRPRMSGGVACSSGLECDSDFCVDGVCCDALCDGPCEACDQAGSRGVCRPHAAGADPDADCTAGGDSCNGAGLCHCSDGMSSVDETGVDCGGPTCDACALGQGCDAPSDCLSDACVNNLCVSPSCGDGFVNGLDECDGTGLGNPGETATCDVDCTFVACGDGVFNTIAEACDDGGTDPCGPCNETCTGVGSGSVCGDGVVCPDSEIGEESFPGTDACGLYNASCSGPARVQCVAMASSVRIPRSARRSFLVIWRAVSTT